MSCQSLLQRAARFVVSLLLCRTITRLLPRIVHLLAVCLVIFSRLSTTIFRSPSLGMCSKVLKLLPYPGVRSRRFYRFEGEELTKARFLNRHVMELAGMHSFDNLNKTDVILSSSEAKDMEAAMRSIVEATSWWSFVMKSLVLKSSSNASLICHLSLAGARCQLLPCGQFCVEEA